ncbi:hypothetical protein [Cryobacterium sp. GrIS_2_6]|uniref:hypothetical protein n=1 Tax=Cryobacterium sp. GrIS_2_6 TaxID=3162785 RepID=UPI002E030222|nr:hypothetical protein [Cryobacterium psychrotolerans]MEC5149223.1 hypothetical protein [Cryobacterium psychrotolerans]MEC5149304.1 hypothetical protein [Cryobacterium psychrotolerans]
MAAQKDDLYRTRIPGGSASFYKLKELSNRREEELAVAGTPAEGAIRKIQSARSVTADGFEPAESAALTGADVHLTREEARDILYLNNTVAWVLLKSWTLKRDGKPIPLPQSVDDLLDLPKDTKKAIADHAQKIFAAERVVAEDSFQIDPGIEEPDSPTGASDT